MMKIKVEVKRFGPKRGGKVIEPVSASGIKVTRGPEGKSFILEQGHVPGKNVFSKETLGKLDKAWKSREKLVTFVSTMPEDFKKARLEAEQAMAKKGAPRERAVEVVKESLYRQRHDKKNVSEAEMQSIKTSISKEVDDKFNQWMTEFGGRNAEEILDSGYHHGCGDIANVMHHLLKEQGLKTRMIEAVHAHTNEEELDLAERAGQGHVWNEVFQEHKKGDDLVDGKRGHWVPVDASGNKLRIGDKPLEFEADKGWFALVPVSIKYEPEKNVSPETKDRGPALLITEGHDDKGKKIEVGE